MQTQFVAGIRFRRGLQSPFFSASICSSASAKLSSNEVECRKPPPAERSHAWSSIPIAFRCLDRSHQQWPDASTRTCSIISARSNLRISLIAVSHADTPARPIPLHGFDPRHLATARASRPGNHEAEDEARVRLRTCVTAPSANVIVSKGLAASSPNARRMSLGRRLGKSAAVERASRNRGSADPISSSAKKSYSADGSDASGGFAPGVRAANPSTAGQPRAQLCRVRSKRATPLRATPRTRSAVIARSSRVSSKTSP